MSQFCDLSHSLSVHQAAIKRHTFTWHILEMAFCDVVRCCLRHSANHHQHHHTIYHLISLSAFGMPHQAGYLQSPQLLKQAPRLPHTHRRSPGEFHPSVKVAQFDRSIKFSEAKCLSKIEATYAIQILVIEVIQLMVVNFCNSFQLNELNYYLPNFRLQ